MSRHYTKIIGISGVARSGKDTLYSQINKRIPSAKRYSFADEIRRDLSGFVWKRYGIDIYNMTPEQKEELRPLLVFHGQYMKDKVGETYWVDKVFNQIDQDKPDVAVITDVRFPFEFDMVKERGGSVIYVERILEDGTTVGPANNDEAQNAPILRERSDNLIRWKTESNLDSLLGHVDEVLMDVFATKA